MFSRGGAHHEINIPDLCGADAAADDWAIVQDLRAGGLVIVLRHGATFPDQADTDPLNFENTAAQRNLNDKGKALAKAHAAFSRIHSRDFVHWRFSVAGRMRARIDTSRRRPKTCR